MRLLILFLICISVGCAGAQTPAREVLPRVKITGRQNIETGHGNPNRLPGFQFEYWLLDDKLIYRRKWHQFKAIPPKQPETMVQGIRFGTGTTMTTVTQTTLIAYDPDSSLNRHFPVRYFEANVPELMSTVVQSMDEIG